MAADLRGKSRHEHCVSSCCLHSKIQTVLRLYSGALRACEVPNTLCSIGNINMQCLLTHKSYTAWLSTCLAEKSAFSCIVLSETCKLSLIYTPWAFKVHPASFKVISTNLCPDFGLLGSYRMSFAKNFLPFPLKAQ